MLKEYGIPFIFSPLYEYNDLEYEHALPVRRPVGRPVAASSCVSGVGALQGAMCLHIAYAERGKEYGLLVLFSPLFGLYKIFFHA